MGYNTHKIEGVGFPWEVCFERCFLTVMRSNDGQDLGPTIVELKWFKVMFILAGEYGTKSYLWGTCH